MDHSSVHSGMILILFYLFTNYRSRLNIRLNIHSYSHQTSHYCSCCNHNDLRQPLYRKQRGCRYVLRIRFLDNSLVFSFFVILIEGNQKESSDPLLLLPFTVVIAVTIFSNRSIVSRGVIDTFTVSVSSIGRHLVLLF